MKKLFRISFVSLSLALSAQIAKSQTIYQLTPLPNFGTHSDGSIRPGDNPPSNLGSQALFDTGFNVRGMAYNPGSNSIVIVDAHSGSGGSTDVRGGIYVLEGDFG